MSENLIPHSKPLEAHLQDEPQPSTALYPGVAEYFDSNLDWLGKLGMSSVEDLNGMVDVHYERYLKTDSDNRKIGFSTVTIPNSLAYAPSFIKHMEVNKDKYKEMAQARYQKEQEYNEALETAEKEKPIRRQRTNAYRDKIERISDKLFEDFDVEGIDIYQPVNFTAVPDITAGSKYDFNTLKFGLGKADFPVDFHSISKALDYFPPTLYPKYGRVRPLAQDSNGLLLFQKDIFDTTGLNTSAMSIGEYGSDITQKIAQTVSVIGALLKQNEASFRDMHEEFGHMLVRSIDVNGDEAVPMLSLYEGVLSVGQALNLMVQDRVDGYDDPEILVRDLVDQGVLLKFARSFNTMGIIGPMNLLGYKFPNLVATDKNKEGRLKLDEEYTEAQKADREYRIVHESGKIVATILEGASFDVKKHETFISLEGCPATVSSYNRDTGKSRNVVKEVAELFMEIFSRIDIDKVEKPQELQVRH